MKALAALLFVMLLFVYTNGEDVKTIDEDFDIFEILGQFVEVKIHDTEELENSKDAIIKDSSDSQWIQATSNMTMYLYEYPYNLIFQYSFKDIDDLGDYYSWNEGLAGVAQYYSLNVNVTNIPFNLRFGVCIPVEWTQTMMTGVANKLNDFMISTMNLLSNIQELSFIKTYGLGIEMGFVAPKEALKHIRAGKEIPAIFVSSIFFIFFILCCIFTWVHTIRSYLLEAIYKRLGPVCQKLKRKRPDLSCECSENLLFMRSFLNQSVKEAEAQGPKIIKDLSDQVQTVDSKYIPSGRSSSMKDLKILDSLEISEGLYKSTNNKKSRILDEIQHVADELSEIERIESKHVNQDKYIEIFSFKSNIDFLYKSNSSIKYDKKNDLEWMNLLWIIVGTWGLLISTPYYLLATPIYNVWRFLVLFGQPIVIMIYSGYCAPQLIILISSFFGFVLFDKKYEEVNKSTVLFLKVSGFILLKKYVKFFILTTVATAFTLYISPFLIDSSSYYTSGISYETWYRIRRCLVP